MQAYIDLQRYRDMELLARQNYSLHEETLKQIGEQLQGQPETQAGTDADGQRHGNACQWKNEQHAAEAGAVDQQQGPQALYGQCGAQARQQTQA